MAEEKGGRPARILEAADALFTERGYDAVSVRDIARQAGVNKALVFYHFDNKAALFERILARYYAAHLTALERAFQDRGGGRRERFHRLVDAYFDFMAANRRYPRLVQQQVASGEAHDLVRENLGRLLQWTEAALGDLTPTEGPLAARQFFVTFSGMVINFFTYGPLMADQWGADPTSDVAAAERRDHVHWMVDRILDGLEEGE